MNVTLAGLTAPSVGVELDRPIVTSPVGSEVNTTVNVSVPPPSSVTRPVVGSTTIPAVSSSLFVTVTSEASMLL